MIFRGVKMKKILFGIIAAALMTMLAFAVSAEVVVTYDFEEVDASQGIYKVVGTLTDTEGDFRAWKNDITFDYSLFKPVNKTTYAAIDIATNTTNKASLNRFTYYSESEGDDVTASWAQVVWSVSGDTAKLVYETYITPDDAIADNSLVFEMTVKFVDGKSVKDMTENSFVVDYIAYANGKNNYYNSTDSSANNISFANNVNPKPVTAITVPVVAGDVVYLQDGSFATAATTGDYNVLLTSGYVVVNTGYTAQSTYYVDGRTATLVHTNGVVAKEDLSLRDRTPAADGNDKNGLRFIVNHNPEARAVAGHAVSEMGFIMTAETTKVIEACGEDYVLDMNMVANNIGTEEKPVFAAKKGAAYVPAEEVDIVYNKTSDTLWQIAGVFYGIPTTSEGVKTTIVSRPYYKVGETYVYGEIVKSTLYDVALALSTDDSFEFASASMKAYIEEVLDAGNGSTGEVLDELMINLDGLFD